jgi:hypothetical protein
LLLDGSGCAWIRSKEQVLENGEPAEDAAPLRNVRDTQGCNGVGRYSVEVMSIQADRAAINGDQAADRPQGRRLAGAIGPN